MIVCIKDESRGHSYIQLNVLSLFASKPPETKRYRRSYLPTESSPCRHHHIASHRIPPLTVHVLLCYVSIEHRYSHSCSSPASISLFSSYHSYVGFTLTISLSSTRIHPHTNLPPPYHTLAFPYIPSRVDEPGKPVIWS